MNFVDLKTLKQSSLGNWLIVGAQLNVSFLDALVRIALKPDEIILNVQCGASLTLLGLHK